jgi:glycosyltransferase involved in cell wall biosynthesis
MMERRVEVTFVADYLATGGAERHAVTLANGLDRSRFEVSFLQLKPGGPLEALLEKSRLARFDCVDVARKVDHDAVARFARHLETSRCRVIVAANPYATLYSILASRRVAADGRPRVISTFHSTILRGLKNQVQMAFYRLMYPFCDVLVYVCENQRVYWRRRALRARTEAMIYNGIDTAYFSADSVAPGRESVRRKLGFAGTDYVVGICAALRPEKAHGDLLEAIARLRALHRPVRCLMIGDGAEREALEGRMRSLGIADRVVITGYEMDVRPYVAACDVMVLTSHSETFSLSALESMAMGKPMVMTRTGGAAEQVTDGTTGLLFAPGDVATLASHLDSLAVSARSEQMGAAAAQDVGRRFPLGKMIADYSALVEAQASPTVLSEFQPT